MKPFFLLAFLLVVMAKGYAHTATITNLRSTPAIVDFSNTVSTFVYVPPTCTISAEVPSCVGIVVSETDFSGPTTLSHAVDQNVSLTIAPGYAEAVATGRAVTTANAMPDTQFKAALAAGFATWIIPLTAVVIMTLAKRGTRAGGSSL